MTDTAGAYSREPLPLGEDGADANELKVEAENRRRGEGVAGGAL